VTLLPIKLTAGKQVRELWYRVTITLDEVQIDPSGLGRSIPYRYGETEDYLLQRPTGIWLSPPPEEGKKEKREREEKEKEEKEKNEKFSVRCVPGVRVIPHGAAATFYFLLKDKAKRKKRGPIFGSFPGGRKGKGFKIKVLPSPNQRGVPRGFVRSRAFRYTSTNVDPPERIQQAKVRVTFSRGKVTRRVTCTVIIVHAGKGRHKKGKKKLLPPKIKPVRCEGACSGALPTQPPTKGTTITDYKIEPGDHVRLRIDPTDPLNGFTIPLRPPNPTPRDPPDLSGGNQHLECELKPLDLTGGPAAVRCKLDPPAPFAVDSFFDITYRIDLSSAPPAISGTLDAPDGTPVESFEAKPGSQQPPEPMVSGTGTLAPGPQPNAVNFKVTLDAQNTTLEHFVIQVPLSLEVKDGGAAGFSCEPADLEGENRALACDGTVTSGQEIQGGFELEGPRPGQLALGTKLLGSPEGGKLYGPFDLTQTPNQPSGSGSFSPPSGNTFNFGVVLNSFGALNQFLLDFPDGVVVVNGEVANPPATLNCNPVETAEAANGLKCDGPITSGQSMQGSFTLTTAPAGLGASSELFASGPATSQFGPLTITDSP
jgi:hypothetical protein